MSESGKRKANFSGLTPSEIAELQQILAENANAVLGASDEKNCSYPKGYVKRQALYSCLTCIPESKADISKCAGVCLACCIHCHEGHELVELYTKRNFRCDCGNSKFPDFKCMLEPAKSAFNVLNVYDQNFSGLYCICHRPYPDEEDQVVDTMLQCIICEDWFHTRHLGVEVPFNTYAEMTCENCIRKHDFLLYYDYLCITKDAEEKGLGNGIIPQPPDPIESINSPFLEAKPLEDRPPDCKLPKVKTKIICTKFWEDVTWRQQLCNCESCLKMYEDQKISFITDLQDTVHEYEELGKSQVAAEKEDYKDEDYENEEEAEEEEEEEVDTQEDLFLFGALESTPMPEDLFNYNEVLDCLRQFAQKYTENGRVIRSADVKEFFHRINDVKKARLNSD